MTSPVTERAQDVPAGLGPWGTKARIDKAIGRGGGRPGRYHTISLLTVGCARSSEWNEPRCALLKAKLTVVPDPHKRPGQTLWEDWNHG